MTEVIASVAAFGTVLMGIGTMAAWRSSKKAIAESQNVHVEVKTNHGMRAGEYLELIHSDMQELRTLMIQHVTDRNAHN